ncbi:MAG: glycosyltransferase, partial [Acidobacteria bacterium]|nr:glycosyltransferase [Acidobacteriota bacterium]
ISALAHTREPVRVKFAGASGGGASLEDARALAASLGVADRAEWLGEVSEGEKRELYARSLGVVYTPVDEDYGYVTLEAMLSAKPVVTCTDSGGVLEFVGDAETGVVAAPDAASLASALDGLWSDRQRARTLGERGRALYEQLGISWSHVVSRLLA